jgi:hypothetical protein
VIPSYQSQLPTIGDVVSDLIAELAVGLLFLIVGYLFFRRSRARAASWDERNADIYEQIRVQLYGVIQAQEALSADEEAAETDDQKRLTHAERGRWSNQSRTAQDEVEAILKEHRYRLAPRAIDILETFFGNLSNEEILDTTRPDLIVLIEAQRAYRDLGELLPAEVGRARGVEWRLRLLRRWLEDQWYKLKTWARGLMWNLNKRVEDFGLLTGPQLTQDNVRNPPRVEHWKTVEQMETRGASRLAIQRHLHEQLAADPPPWLPVPLSGRFHTWADPESRKPSPRLHDEGLGPLRTGDAADVCAPGVPLTEACRPCGFVVMPKDFAWGTDLPEEDRRPRRKRARPRSGTRMPLPLTGEGWRTDGPNRPAT